MFACVLCVPVVLPSFIFIYRNICKCTVQACLARSYLYLAAFFQYSRCLLRQNVVGACLYMPQEGHWLAILEVIPPHPKKLALPRPKNGNSPLKPLFLSGFCSKFAGHFFRSFYSEIVSRQSRLSQTLSDLALKMRFQAKIEYCVFLFFRRKNCHAVLDFREQCQAVLPD